MKKSKSNWNNPIETMGKWWFSCHRETPGFPIDSPGIIQPVSRKKARTPSCQASTAYSSCAICADGGKAIMGRYAYIDMYCRCFFQIHICMYIYAIYIWFYSVYMGLSLSLSTVHTYTQRKPFHPWFPLMIPEPVPTLCSMVGITMIHTSDN